MAGNDSLASVSVESASLQYLNSNLLSHGFAKLPVCLDGLATQDERNVVAIMSSLLQQRIDDMRTSEHLSAALQKQQYDVTRLAAQLAKLTASHAKLETESSAFKAREAEQAKRTSDLVESNRALREENARTRSALASVKVNAQHESKKTQLKLDRAVAQLQKLSTDASLVSSPSGIIQLNPIAPGQDVSETPKMGTLLEMSLRDLADIRESLQEETEAFRHVVLGVGNSLRELLALSLGHEAPPRLLHSQFFSVTSPSKSWQASTSSCQVSSSTSHPTLADQRLRELLTQLRNRILDPPEPSIADPSVPSATQSLAETEAEGRKVEEMRRRIGELEMDLVEAGKREEEGRRLMQEFASNLPLSGPTSVRDAEDEEDVKGSEIAADLEMLKQQRKAIDKERRRLAQEAVNLGREREQLEATKQAIAERQRTQALEALLEDLPPTPATGLASSSTATLANAPTPRPDDFPTFEMSPNLKALLERPAPPASPHTPKAKQHAVGRRRKTPAGPGTPLARMVMAKAVARAGGAAVLGVEGGKKTNARAPTRTSGGTLGGSVVRNGFVDGVGPKAAKKSGWR